VRERKGKGGRGRGGKERERERRGRVREELPLIITTNRRLWRNVYPQYGDSNTIHR